jgi:Lamin Tail Domain
MSRVLLGVVCLFLLVVPFASGATSSASVVVSQVYAGGGNAGATYANDYVELFNRSSSAVSVTGWTVQYASAASASWTSVPLAGSIRAGGYYLVKLSGGTTGAALPTADATGSANLAASGGKIAVSRGSADLTCGATAGSCTGLEDLVGYGGAVDFEGADAAPALTNTTALLRAGGGCTDTNSNPSDFTAGDPSPRNSASAASVCSSGGGSPPPSSTTGSASVAVDVQPMLSVALEKTSISFGNAFAGETPAPVSEKVTVISNNASGYSLTVHRSAFTPADLPLGISPSPPAGLVAIPISSDLTIGSSSVATAAAGDVWSTSIGFTSPLPVVAPGHYTSTITFTVIGK